MKLLRLKRAEDVLRAAYAMLPEPHNLLKAAFWNRSKTCFCADGALIVAGQRLEGLEHQGRYDRAVIDARIILGHVAGFNEMTKMTKDGVGKKIRRRGAIWDWSDSHDQPYVREAFAAALHWMKLTSERGIIHMIDGEKDEI